MDATIYFIGAGPGDPELLTLKGRQIVDSADVIVYAGSRVNPALLDGARPDAAVHDSSVLDLRQATDIMMEAARRNKTVAYLHIGGSLLCGAIAEQVAVLRDAGVECSIVPGVSSMFGAAVPLSRLNKPDFAHAFRVVPGRRREGKAVVALTRRGWHTGMRILDAFEDVELFLPERFRADKQSARLSFYEDLGPLLGNLFQTRLQLVLIMAVGVAVRKIAPYLGSRWEEPAVVTLDDSGRNSISLLAGHWGGANMLADDVARVLGGNSVITTESDVMGFPAVDILIRHLTGAVVPEDSALLKRIQAAILDGDSVGFYPRDLETAHNMRGHAHLHFYDSLDELAEGDCVAGLIVSSQQDMLPGSGDDFARVHPRALTVGIGCRHGATAAEIEQGVRSVFAEHNLSLQSIAAICTVDHRCAEDGLIEFAGSKGVPLEFFSAVDINKVVSVSAEPKAVREVGVQGVAEPAALLGSSGGSLLVPHVQLKSMTIAVAARPIRQILQDSGADSDVC